MAGDDPARHPVLVQIVLAHLYAGAVTARRLLGEVARVHHRATAAVASHLLHLAEARRIRVDGMVVVGSAVDVVAGEAGGEDSTGSVVDGLVTESVTGMGNGTRTVIARGGVVGRGAGREARRRVGGEACISQRLATSVTLSVHMKGLLIYMDFITTSETIPSKTR